ncbi:MAG: dienelactone hydrolase family protein [Pseudomonadota bacterium]
MSERVSLTTSGGHSLSAYLATPDEGAPRGALVVCQEIFGVNRHIRAITDGFANEGYLAIAPALFDRVKPDVELGYDEEDVAEGRRLRPQVAWDDAVEDIQAAVEHVAGAGKTGVIGHCWGGSLAWLAACRLGIDAAVCYYGGHIFEHRAETPNCPVLMHFGEIDQAIPMDQVAAIRELHTGAQIFTYPAGHGFNCDLRGSYDQDSATLAADRTNNFLLEHIG